MGNRRSDLLFKVLCLAIALAGFSSQVMASEKPPAQSRTSIGIQKRVDAVARGSLKKLPLAGLSVAVMRGDRLELARGYGLADLDKRVPAAGVTVYRTGSVGKQFTAATLMVLAEQKELSLDDPLGRYLPDFPEALHEITIRQLLSHTAGLREINADPRFARTQGVGMTPAQVLRLAAQQPLEFKPGTKFSYSNTGYLVSAAIIEKVTGRPAAEYITREVMRPLALSDTSDCRRARSRRWARGYELQEQGGWSRVVRLGRFPALVAPRPINLKAISGAGAFCSTPVDLVKWTQHLHHGDVVGPSSLQQMTEPAPLPGGQKAPYGLGTQVRSFGRHPALGHAGIIWGFNAVVAHFPDEDLAVSMMLNTMLPEKAGKRLWEEVLGAVFNERPAEWKEPRYHAAPKAGG